MFELSRGMAAVPLDPAGLLELYSSVNQPQIAADTLDAQEARAYFVTGRGRMGIEAYIYLHMLSSNAALVYRWMEPIDKSDYPLVQEQGVQFTESMGFMMEDLQIRRVDDTVRRNTLAGVPIFSPLAPRARPQPQAQPASTDAGAGAEVVLLDNQPGDLEIEDSILELRPDAPPTQVGYIQAPAPPPQPQSADPLEDKNFKVFLRLLTSA